METIKAYYKAVTTSKDYIVIEDISTNYLVYKYIATNNLDKYYKDMEDGRCSIISCDYYYENLDVLKSLFNELNASWTKFCYHYDWTEFLRKYELSENQYKIIKRLVKN